MFSRGGWDAKKLSEAHFPHLALFLCVSVDRSCLSRGNLVLRSQLRADLNSLFPFSLIFSRRSHPVAVVGEADGDDDEDEDRDDGHHHHVGGEQSCQVIWCSAEKKTVNNMKSYTQQACNIEKSLSMNEKGKYKNNPKLHNITHTLTRFFLLPKAQRTSISYDSFYRFYQYRQL